MSNIEEGTKAHAALEAALKPKASRFDYVKYDENAVTAQANLKAKFEELEELILNETTPGRAQALIMTKLEEGYMWCGKAIRDDQIKRNGSAELQEGRSNS